MNKTIWAVLAVLVVCLASYFGGRVKGCETGRKQGYAQGYKAGYNTPHPADTIIHVDTFIINHPVPVEREVVRTDTLYRHDTLFVALEIERRTYEGEDYRAEVSGWHPSLDWIEVYPTTTYITKEVQVPGPPARWSLGVTAGPGILWDGKIHGGIGIVAGLQYRF